MADLEVELYGRRAGSLRGDWRGFDFEADRDAVGHWGLNSPALSVAVPLALRPDRGRKERRRAFFAELLPEGEMLKGLAAEAQVAAYDTVGLLRHYGRDVAGALQIWDPDMPGEPRVPRTQALSEDEVARMLRDVMRSPLGNRTPAGKSSLAGVQEKIVLVRRGDGGWASALDGYPSTHIVKPAPRTNPAIVFDEEFGARIARAAGLASFGTELRHFAGTPGLVIERYDRSPDAPQGRIHQEDFNQALGAVGNEKYQEIGGRVSLERIARVLREHAGDGSLHRLVKMVTVSAAVGNLDMHAKNVSLVHRYPGEIELAPMYDVVPQSHHAGVDGRLALAVNGVYVHRELTRRDIADEARRWGVRNPEVLVDEALAQTLAVTESESPLAGAYPGLASDIARFSKNLLGGDPAGAEARSPARPSGPSAAGGRLPEARRLERGAQDSPG